MEKSSKITFQQPHYPFPSSIALVQFSSSLAKNDEHALLAKPLPALPRIPLVPSSSRASRKQRLRIHLIHLGSAAVRREPAPRQRCGGHRLQQHHPSVAIPPAAKLQTAPGAGQERPGGIRSWGRGGRAASRVGVGALGGSSSQALLRPPSAILPHFTPGSSAPAAQAWPVHLPADNSKRRARGVGEDRRPGRGPGRREAAELVASGGDRVRFGGEG
jgi:hypothetical protein